MKLKTIIARTESEVSECLRLRHVVFVEEQCVPLDMEIDEHDTGDAIHFLGRVEAEAVAAGRVCLLGKIAKIQRVAVLREMRGSGLGAEFMQFIIRHIRANDLAPSIALDAQTHALNFYQKLGFQTQGDEFDDAGIPHIHMTMPA